MTDTTRRISRPEMSVSDGNALIRAAGLKPKILKDVDGGSSWFLRVYRGHDVVYSAVVEEGRMFGHVERVLQLTSAADQPLSAPEAT